MHVNKFFFVIVGLVFVGWFHRSLAQILIEFFANLRTGITACIEILNHGTTKIRSWIKDIFEREKMPSAHGRVSFFVGAFLNALFFIIFLFADAYLISLSLKGFLLDSHTGSIPIEELFRQAGISFLTGLSLLIAPVCAGMVLLDVLGLTHLTQWSSASKRNKIIGVSFAVIVLLITLFLLSSLGIWRSYVVSITDESFSLPRWYITLLSYWMIAYAIVVTISLLLSAMGMKLVLLFINAFALVFIMAGIWLLGSCFRIIRAIFDILWAVLHAILQFISRIMIMLSRPLVTLFNSIYEWGETRQKGTLSYIFAMTVSSWSQDIEVPQQGIGTQRDLNEVEKSHPDSPKKEEQRVECNNQSFLLDNNRNEKSSYPEFLDNDKPISRNWSPFASESNQERSEKYGGQDE
jgi:hypothetical protein